MHTQVHYSLIGCDQGPLQGADTSLRHDSEAHTVSYRPCLGQDAHGLKSYNSEYLAHKSQVWKFQKPQYRIKAKVTCFTIILHCV